MTGKNRNNLGFTIVELLIVIVIIGILAAITIVSYVGISKRATEAGLISDLSSAKRQLELYKTEHETYPTIMDTNKCPTNPINDTKYCLKNKDFEYITIDNGLTYSLKLTKSDITLEVTNDSTPKIAEVVTVEPEPIVLDETDWITVGTQRWARENLNVGTRIDSSLEQTDNGGANVVEKYCYNNIDANCTTYGGLYLWGEAMSYANAEGAQGICPVGSHIPSDNDWKILEVYLGMTQVEADTTGPRGTSIGSKLKTGGSSGLNMRLGGYRSVTDKLFYKLDQYGYWWSSSEFDVNDAWYRTIISSLSTVSRNDYKKTSSYSVRCLGN